MILVDNRTNLRMQLATGPKALVSDAGLRLSDQVFRAGKFAEAKISDQAILQKDGKLAASHRIWISALPVREGSLGR